MKPFIFLTALFVINACGSNKNQTSETQAKSTDTTRKKNNPPASLNSINNFSFIYGLDISHSDGNVVDKLNEYDSIDFVICKATQGITIKDKTFDRNWNAISEKGLIRGAYHFFECEYDPVHQADFFYKAVGNLSDKDLPPIIIFETSVRINSDCASHNFGEMNTSENIIIFIKQVEKNFRRKPIISVNRADANLFMRDAFFASYPLWLVSPKDKLEEHDVPVAWNGSWTFWLRSFNYKIDTGNHDLNIFNGDSLALVKFITNSIIR